jgi:hypothetical protein
VKEIKLEREDEGVSLLLFWEFRSSDRKTAVLSSWCLASPSLYLDPVHMYSVRNVSRGGVCVMPFLRRDRPAAEAFDVSASFVASFLSSDDACC